MTPTKSPVKDGKASKSASSAKSKPKPKPKTVVQGRIQRTKPKAKMPAPALRRRQMTLERPPPLHHRIEALLAAEWPARKPATNAYNDLVTKRHRYDHSSDLTQMPWDEPGGTRRDRFGHQIELPGYTVRDLRSGGSPAAEPVVAGPRLSHHASSKPAAAAAAADPLGSFGRLPTEIRERIFRRLLVHPLGDVPVLRGWTLVYPRRRPRLATAVLRVCRAFHAEGARVLYGANRFVYRLRDPSGDERPRDTATVVRYVYGREALPLARHGGHLRHVRVVVEANRMHRHDCRRNLPAALELLRPDSGVIRPKRLMTITLELPAQTRRQLNMMGGPNDRVSQERGDDVPVASWFKKGSPVLRVVEELQCQFLRIIAHTSSGEYYEAVIDRRPYFSQVLGNGGSTYDIWKDDKLMLEARCKAASQSQARLHTMDFWLRMLVRDPQYAVLQGPFQFYTSEEENREPLEALPSNSSTRSSRNTGRHAPMSFRLSDYLPDLGDGKDLDWTDNDDGASVYLGGMDDEDEEETRVVQRRKPKATSHRRRREA